jgi:four helix bundle protein
MQNAKLNSPDKVPRSFDIQNRAFAFALQIIRLCRQMDDKPGTSRLLSRQLLRSGTSIGANLEEAQAGHSRADFICKVEIALKEARETCYWLRLISGSETVTGVRVNELQCEAEQLKRILGAIAVSAKDNREARAAKNSGVS